MSLPTVSISWHLSTFGWASFRIIQNSFIKVSILLERLSNSNFFTATWTVMHNRIWGQFFFCVKKMIGMCAHIRTELSVFLLCDTSIHCSEGALSYDCTWNISTCVQGKPFRVKPVLAHNRLCWYVYTTRPRARQVSSEHNFKSNTNGKWNQINNINKPVPCTDAAWLKNNNADYKFTTSISFWSISKFQT